MSESSGRIAAKLRTRSGPLCGHTGPECHLAVAWDTR